MLHVLSDVAEGDEHKERREDGEDGPDGEHRLRGERERVVARRVLRAAGIGRLGCSEGLHGRVGVKRLHGGRVEQRELGAEQVGRERRDGVPVGHVVQQGDRRVLHAETQLIQHAVQRRTHGCVAGASQQLTHRQRHSGNSTARGEGVLQTHQELREVEIVCVRIHSSGRQRDVECIGSPCSVDEERVRAVESARDVARQVVEVDLQQRQASAEGALGQADDQLAGRAQRGAGVAGHARDGEARQVELAARQVAQVGDVEQRQHAGQGLQLRWHGERGCGSVAGHRQALRLQQP